MRQRGGGRAQYGWHSEIKMIIALPSSSRGPCSGRCCRASVKRLRPSLQCVGAVETIGATRLAPSSTVIFDTQSPDDGSRHRIPNATGLGNTDDRCDVRERESSRFLQRDVQLKHPSLDRRMLIMKGEQPSTQFVFAALEHSELPLKFFVFCQ